MRTQAVARRRPLDPQRRRRSGAAGATTPTTACASPAPTGTCRSTGASRGSRAIRRARRDGRAIRQINGDAEFCQEFFDDVELTDDDVIGEVNDGWTVTQTMLIYERGGGTAHGDSGRAGSGGCGATSSTLVAAVDGADDPRRA